MIYKDDIHTKMAAIYKHEMFKTCRVWHRHARCTSRKPSEPLTRLKYFFRCVTFPLVLLFNRVDQFKINILMIGLTKIHHSQQIMKKCSPLDYVNIISWLTFSGIIPSVSQWQGYQCPYSFMLKMHGFDRVILRINGRIKHISLPCTLDVWIYKILFGLLLTFFYLCSYDIAYDMIGISY